MDIHDNAVFAVVCALIPYGSLNNTALDTHKDIQYICAITVSIVVVLFITVRRFVWKMFGEDSDIFFAILLMIRENVVRSFFA